MSAPTPAPAYPVPYDYTRQGILERWTREKMLQMHRKPEEKKRSN